MEMPRSSNRRRSTKWRARGARCSILIILYIVTTTAQSISGAAAGGQKPTYSYEVQVVRSINTNLWERFVGADLDPCTGHWPGITCDGGTPFQHIIGINLTNSAGMVPSNFFPGIVQLSFLNSLLLAGCKLNGPIPGNLSFLRSLQVLDLTDNSLTGEIPTEFGRFLFLENLSLSQNLLIGQVPEELCQAERLQVLMLDGNGLGGSIPPCLGNLSSLTVLSLFSNNLTGSIPELLGHLEDLTELNLANNSLTGSLPAALTGLVNLRKLHLSGNILEGALPVSFQRMSNLLELYLDSNRFSGPIPDSICSVHTLQKLRLFDNQLNGSIPGDIGNLTQLTVLFLQVNQLSGPLPMSLGNLTLLQQLHLQGNGFTGTLPGRVLARLTNLQSLYAHFNALEGEIPIEILSLSQLANVSLGFNNFSGSIPSPNGQKSDKKLTLGSLQLISLCNNSLTGVIPSKMGLLGNLRYLDLSSNQLSGPIPSALESSINSNSLQANLVYNNLDNNSWAAVEGSDFACLQIANSSLNSECRTAGLSRGLGINVGGPLYSSQAEGGTNYDADNNFSSPLDVYEYPSSDVSTASWVLSMQGVADEEPFLQSSCPLPVGSKISDWTLFQTARVGADTLSYRVQSLKPGDYMVDLSFAELDPAVHRPGQRVFNVYIQGELRNSSLDILKVTGGTMKPLVINLPVSTSDGMIEVRLVGRGSWPATEEQMGVYHGPILSALHIHQVNKRSSRWVLLTGAGGGGSVLGLAGLLTLSACCVSYLRKRRSYRPISYTWNKMGLLSFKLTDLEAATNKFSEANLLGQGGFGRVYKGVLPDGTTIAIKQLCIPNQKSLESLQNELQVISTVRHRNLVSLIGCCLEQECPVIVCQYMPNGNLHDALFKDSSPVYLSWSSRYKVALDVAKGLHYLHEESVHKIVHRDVKPGNILLDNMLRAHIADFGMARLLAEQEIEVITGVMGTRGYMAPEYALNGQLSDKVDVYSFGVVLLELVTGRRGVQTDIMSSEKISLCYWAWQMFTSGNFEEMLDKHLGKDYVFDEFMTMLKVSIWCTEYYPSLRPSMNQVLHMLTGKVAIPPIALQRKGYHEELGDLSRPFADQSWESFIKLHGSRGPIPVLDHSRSLPLGFQSADRFIPTRDSRRGPTPSLNLSASMPLDSGSSDQSSIEGR